MTKPKDRRNNPAHRGWDERRGTPKNAKAVARVDRAHGRYSASEQADDDRRRAPPRPTKKPVGT